MPARDPKEVFLMLLSDVRQNTERAAKFYLEVSNIAQHPQIKEALEARAFVSEKVLATLDQCFKIIGQQPVKLSGRLQEVFIEDFRREMAEIQSPLARQLFVLAKVNHLTQFRVGEFMALISAADLTGNYAVGLLLETCLADKLAFVERNRRLITAVIEKRVADRVAA